MTHIIEIYGGPGCGKTILKQRLPYLFLEKFPEKTCEIIEEKAKLFAFEKNNNVFQYQEILIGEQIREIVARLNKINILITDAPLECACYYGEEAYPKDFHNFLRWRTSQWKTIPIYMQRAFPYQHEGRIHSEEEAQNLDKKILDYLKTYKKRFITYHPKEESLETLFQHIQNYSNLE